MRLRTWFRLGCLAAICYVLVRLGLAYDALPAQMASHWSSSGRADRFMPKGEVVPHLVALQVLASSTCSLMSFGLSRLPIKLINVPNRDYWFAPERRDATIEKLGIRLDALSLFLAVLIAWLNEDTIRANLDGSYTMTLPGLPPTLLLVFFVGWMASILRAFPMRTPNAP